MVIMTSVNSTAGSDLPYLYLCLRGKNITDCLTLQEAGPGLGGPGQNREQEPDEKVARDILSYCSL